MAIDEEKLNQFLGTCITDFGATMHAGLVVIGERLGLYKAMTPAGKAVTPAELAKLTETNERYVREWLNAQAAGGYVSYDADNQTYFLQKNKPLQWLTKPARLICPERFYSPFLRFEPCRS